MFEICADLTILLEIFALVVREIPLDHSPKMDLVTHRLHRVIEGKGDAQVKPLEKVINGLFMRVTEDLKEYRGPYLSLVDVSPAGE